MRCGALLVTALVGMAYLSVGSAYAGAGDEKKIIKPEVVKVILQAKEVKVEPVVKEAIEQPKSTSDINAFAVRNVNPFFFRPFFNPFFNPFFFDVDAPFFGD